MLQTTSSVVWLVTLTVLIPEKLRNEKSGLYPTVSKYLPNIQNDFFGRQQNFKLITFLNITTLYI